MDVKHVDGERGGRAADRRREAALRTSGILAGRAPGRSLSEELIAERREEARCEDTAEEDAAAVAPGTGAM